MTWKYNIYLYSYTCEITEGSLFQLFHYFRLGFLLLPKHLFAFYRCTEINKYII